MEECRGTYPLWTPLTHRMWTALYYKAGNDSNILELHTFHVLMMNHIIFQPSDKLSAIQLIQHLNHMIFTITEQKTLQILQALWQKAEIFKAKCLTANKFELPTFSSI